MRKEAFNGLPGVLADALPDAFGTSVIRSYFTARGELRKALSPVQHLLYVGSRAIGALEFRPAEDVGATPRIEEALEIATLVADARRIIEGRADVTIPEIYRIGSSAGGMRPKAVATPATVGVSRRVMRGLAHGCRRGGRNQHHSRRLRAGRVQGWATAKRVWRAHTN